MSVDNGLGSAASEPRRADDGARIVLLATCAEVAALDGALARSLGMHTADLMEVAGIGCFLAISDILRPGARVVVACGGGNNGGDGFVLARYAAAAGLATRVFAMEPPKARSAPALHADRLGRFEVPIESGLVAFAAATAASDVVVDALFGTGARLPLRDPAPQWIAAINAGHAQVVSLDLPSGLDGDTGDGAADCVRALATVAIGALKPGLLTQAGARAAGDVRLAPLPYPPSSISHLRRVPLPKSWR